jgi:hypothetical protein
MAFCTLSAIPSLQIATLLHSTPMFNIPTKISNRHRPVPQRNIMTHYFRFSYTCAWPSCKVFEHKVKLKITFSPTPKHRAMTWGERSRCGHFTHLDYSQLVEPTAELHSHYVPHTVSWYKLHNGHEPTNLASIIGRTKLELSYPLVLKLVSQQKGPTALFWKPCEEKTQFLVPNICWLISNPGREETRNERSPVPIRFESNKRTTAEGSSLDFPILN